jgi:GST-like protein
MERKRTPGLVNLAGPDAAQQKSMLEVHAFTTPNSIKVPIALEEMGLDYRLVPVNLRQGEHKTDAFKAMNPTRKSRFSSTDPFLGTAT